MWTQSEPKKIASGFLTFFDQIRIGERNIMQKFYRIRTNIPVRKNILNCHLSESEFSCGHSESAWNAPDLNFLYGFFRGFRGSREVIQTNSDFLRPKIQIQKGSNIFSTHEIWPRNRVFQPKSVRAGRTFGCDLTTLEDRKRPLKAKKWPHSVNKMCSLFRPFLTFRTRNKFLRLPKAKTSRELNICYYFLGYPNVNLQQ